jgi:hypothetical protein
LSQALLSSPLAESLLGPTILSLSCHACVA